MAASSSSSLYDEALDAAGSDSADGDDSSDTLEYPSARGMRGPRSVARRGPHPVVYSFAQAFGEKGADGFLVAPVQEADLISTVRFANGEDLVATGDKGGRIVILKRGRDSSPARSSDASVDAAEDGAKPGGRAARLSGGATSGDESDVDDDDWNEAKALRREAEESDVSRGVPNFLFWTQFQSHEPEFDYLKSMEIEEKINQIRWCRRINGDHRLIATNDKTIKVWRVCEKKVTEVTTLTSPVNSRGSASGCSDGNDSRATPWASKPLSLPVLERRGNIVQATPRRIFSGAHAYHINSISLNSDEETFLSSDDLRVNMWNLNLGGNGFNILDVKPENMEELTEVITACEFHPQHCHLFMHSSSRGVAKLCDLRQSALCQTWAKEYEVPASEASSQSSFFAEIIASVSDISFSPDGRYLLTRDYMNLRLWDLNMERAPVLSVPVHDHLSDRLSDLYENDSIFDKFQCSFSHDGGSLLTGSYNSMFHAYSAANGEGAAVEATIDFISGMSGRDGTRNLDPDNYGNVAATELLDPTRRILHLDASSKSQIAAVAAGPALYIYYGDQQQFWNR